MAAPGGARTGGGRHWLAALLGAILAGQPVTAVGGTCQRADFVWLAEVAPGIREEIRYAGAHNFVGRPVAGYLAPVCLLRKATAEALKQVQLRLQQEGLALKVYDCYRPRSAIEDMWEWAHRPTDLATKAEFYPNVAKAELFGRRSAGRTIGGYISRRSRHNRGTAVDVTIVPAAGQNPAPSAGVPGGPCTAPRPARSPDDSLDFGTAWDCLDPASGAAGLGTIPPEAAANREKLSALMAEAGFVGYAREWWHYELQAAGGSGVACTFPVTGDPQ